MKIKNTSTTTVTSININRVLLELRPGQEVDIADVHAAQVQKLVARKKHLTIGGAPAPAKARKGDAENPVIAPTPPVSPQPPAVPQTGHVTLGEPQPKAPAAAATTPAAPKPFGRR